MVISKNKKSLIFWLLFVSFIFRIRYQDLYFHSKYCQSRYSNSTINIHNFFHCDHQCNTQLLDQGELKHSWILEFNELSIRYKIHDGIKHQRLWNSFDSYFKRLCDTHFDFRDTNTSWDWCLCINSNSLLILSHLKILLWLYHLREKWENRLMSLRLKEWFKKLTTPL